jgi:hypothetical protein
MKISTKISVMGVSLVVVSALAMLGIVIVQKQVLRSSLEDIVIHKQASQQASATVQALYRAFEAADTRTQRRLDHNFRVARQQFEQAGRSWKGITTTPGR